MRSQDVFRQNLRELMMEHGLKVKDLADMIGLSPSYLSLILSGERQNLSDFHKDAIALALGTSVASLYTPAAEALSGRGGAGPFSPPDLSASTVRARSRDISAFEEFLRLLNVKDDLLLAAYYRELNGLSDDEIRRFGQVIRASMTSWQEGVAHKRPVETDGEDRPTPGPSSDPALDYRLTSEQRSLVGLVACLWPILGDVPPEVVEVASSWPSARLHRLLGPAVASGVLLIVSGEGDNVALRPSERLIGGSAQNWIALSFKVECLARLGRYFGDMLEGLYSDDAVGAAQEAEAVVLPRAKPEQVAELFLEARDYPPARLWYERAAIDAFGRDMWRAAKQHLAVVFSLDNILRAPAEERVRAYQMMATVCLNLGDLDEALMYQERNIAFWERTGSKSDLTMGLLRAGSILGRQRDWPRAKDYLERALKVSPNDLVAEAQARIGLAAIFASSGFLTSAVEQLERTLDIGGRLNETGILVQSLLGLGRVFLAKGESRRALTALNRASSLAERREHVAEIWVKIEMGKYWFQNGDTERAQREFAGAAERARDAGNLEQEHAAAAHLSRCLALLPDQAAQEEALSRAGAAVRFSAGTGDKHGLVAALVAQAEAGAALGDVSYALESFREAVREGRESGDPVLEAFASDAFGKHLESRGDAMAEVMYRRARWARARIK